jgi:hypothetical protein
MPVEINVVVFGLRTPTCILHDLGIDVPHGVSVAIPGDRAYESKDLWRAIGQKHLFRLNPGSHGGPGVPPPIPAPEPKVVPKVPSLEEENKALKEALVDQAKKLDSILTLLQSVGASIPASPAVTLAPVSRPQVVASEVPTFIPSSITPENSEMRIEAKRGESDDGAVSGAAGKLRELRQKGRV